MTNFEDPKGEGGDVSIRDLFQNTMILGVPQIIRSRGKVRWMKSFIFFICLVGFFYQTYQFIKIFLRFPVQLNIEVQYPDSLLAPSFTICPGVRFSKKKFCRAFRDRCEIVNETLYVKQEHLNDDADPTLEELIKLGPTWSSLEFYSSQTWLNDAPIAPPEDSLRLILADDKRKKVICYVINHQLFHIRKEQIMYPTKSAFLFSQVTRFLHLYMNDNPDLRFRPERTLLAFKVNSPFELSNPYMDGEMLERGKFHCDFFQIRVTRLLPSPYTSDCVDYFQLWREKKTTVLSRQMCIQQCIYQLAKDICGCFPLGILYPADIRFCKEEDMGCLNNVDVDNCYSSCKQDCERYEFITRHSTRDPEWRLSVFLRLLTLTTSSGDTENVSAIHDITGSSVTYDDTSLTVYKYSPKYEVIELFSYIGGYIGVWLGMSLVAIMDFLEICHRALAILMERRRRSTKIQKLNFI